MEKRPATAGRFALMLVSAAGFAAVMVLLVVACVGRGEQVGHHIGVGIAGVINEVAASGPQEVLVFP